MINAKRYPLIVLERIPLEARVLERGSTLTCKTVVGAEFLPPVIKPEPNTESLPEGNLIMKGEPTSFEQSFCRETSDAIETFTLKFEERTVTTDLVISVKKEVNEESKILELVGEEIKDYSGELVSSISGSDVQINLEPLPVAQVFESDKNACSFESSSVTSFVDVISLTAVGHQQTINKGGGKSSGSPCVAANVFHSSSRLILKDVSVKLVDLFSDDTRRRGETHSNEGVCLCMYCQSKFKDSHVSQPLSNKIQKKKRRSGKERFVCSDCPLEFCTALDFMDHCLLNHKNKKPFKCMLCPSTFRRKDSVTEHMRTHSNERPIKCEICSATFKHTYNLKRHIKRHHTTERPYKCKLCPLAFKRKDTLTIHMKIHSSEKPYQCRQCSAVFKHAHSRNVHESFVHTSAKPHQCKQCLLKFKSYFSLKSHMVLHSDERPYCCAYCPAKFKVKPSLLTHILNHTNERPVGCDLCDKRFKYKGELNLHLKTHTREKRFTCEHCPVKCKTKWKMERHLVVHSDARPFECKQCLKKFKLKKALKLHQISVHSEEKPYECAHCLLKFKTKEFLKSHLITHSDTRPFKCNDCRKKFKSKSCLSIHHKIVHIAERRYQCAHCPAKFKNKNAIRYHVTHPHNPELSA